MLKEVGTTSGPKSEKKRLASSTGSQGNNNGIRNGPKKMKIGIPDFVNNTSSSDLKVPSRILRPHEERITLDVPYKFPYEMERSKVQLGVFFCFLVLFCYN